MFMGFSHVFSLVYFGSSKSSGNEIFLRLSLLNHVSLVEEMLNSAVSKDLLIESINSKVNRFLSSDSLEDADSSKSWISDGFKDLTHFSNNL